jgi:hypothetical protein
VYTVHAKLSALVVCASVFGILKFVKSQECTIPSLLLFNILLLYRVVVRIHPIYPLYYLVLLFLFYFFLCLLFVMFLGEQWLPSCFMLSYFQSYGSISSRQSIGQLHVPPIMILLYQYTRLLLHTSKLLSSYHFHFSLFYQPWPFSLCFYYYYYFFAFYLPYPF